MSSTSVVVMRKSWDDMECRWVYSDIERVDVSTPISHDKSADEILGEIIDAVGEIIGIGVFAIGLIAILLVAFT